MRGGSPANPVMMPVFQGQGWSSHRPTGRSRSCRWTRGPNLRAYAPVVRRPAPPSRCRVRTRGGAGERTFSARRTSSPNIGSPRVPGQRQAGQKAALRPFFGLAGAESEWQPALRATWLGQTGQVVAATEAQTLPASTKATQWSANRGGDGPDHEAGPRQPQWACNVELGSALPVWTAGERSVAMEWKCTAEQVQRGDSAQRGALECSNRTLVKGPENDPSSAHESYTLPSA